MIKKQIIKIVIITFVLFMFSFSSNAVILRESFNHHNVIQEALLLGESYNWDTTNESLIEDNNYRISQMDKGLNTVFIIDIHTPFLEIAKISREKSRKYMRVSNEEIRKIVNKNYINIMANIMKPTKIDQDNFYMVLSVPILKNEKVKNKTKIVHPINPYRKFFDYQYIRNQYYYLGYLDYNFSLNDLPIIKGQANYKIEIIVITGNGEKRFIKDLSDIL